MIQYYLDGTTLQPVTMQFGDVYVSTLFGMGAAGPLDLVALGAYNAAASANVKANLLNPARAFSLLTGELFAWTVGSTGTVQPQLVSNMATDTLKQAANFDAALNALVEGFIAYYMAKSGESRATVVARITSGEFVVPYGVYYSGGNANNTRVTLATIRNRVAACTTEVQRRAVASTTTTPPATSGGTSAPAPADTAQLEWLAMVAVKRDTWSSMLTAARSLELRASTMLTGLQSVMATYQADPRKYVAEIATIRDMMVATARNVDYARQLQSALVANLTVVDAILASGDTSRPIPMDPDLAAPPAMPEVVPNPAPSATVVPFVPADVPRSLDAKPVPVVQPAEQAPKSGAGTLVAIGVILSLLN